MYLVSKLASTQNVHSIIVVKYHDSKTYQKIGPNWPMDHKHNVHKDMKIMHAL